MPSIPTSAACRQLSGTLPLTVVPAMKDRFPAPRTASPWDEARLSMTQPASVPELLHPKLPDAACRGKQCGADAVQGSAVGEKGKDGKPSERNSRRKSVGFIATSFTKLMARLIKWINRRKDEMLVSFPMVFRIGPVAPQP